LDESIILLAKSSLASASISTYSCLLQSIQLQWGSSVVRELTHHNYCGNKGHHDCQVALAFGCIQWLTTFIAALGVTMDVCSCVARTTQSSGSIRLVKNYSAYSDISCAWNVMSLLLFFPTKGNLWHEG
jgi:hypothetical protein